MTISKEKTLGQLQEEFSTQFPYLKIKFFECRHGAYEVSFPESELGANVTVGVVNPNVKAGIVSLRKGQTVEAFEQLFQKQFGLNVQVYRKSYGKWLQTWATDIWTLGAQNERSKIMGNKRA